MPLYPPATTTGYTPGGTDVAVADGGTGASTAAAAATNLGLGTGDSPQFTAVNVGAATDTTVTRTGAGDIAVEGNALYRAGGTDVAVADGGTGSSTAANARTALGLAIGTDVDAFASTIGQAEAEAGSATTVRNFTAQRVAQAIAALASGGSALTVKDEGSSLATAATSLDFVGAGVVASGTGAAKTITISGGAGTDYSIPTPVALVENAFTTGTSIALTVPAPTVGNRLLMFVGGTSRGATSITQTNVVWTQLVTNNGNSRYTEVWAGVVSASPGTTATVNFTGSNDCAASYLELPSTAPAFSTAGTPTAVTGGATSVSLYMSTLTVLGDYYAFVCATGGATSNTTCNNPMMLFGGGFGGYFRCAILRSQGGPLTVSSASSTASAMNAILVKIS